MFERFTDHVRRALVLAQDEARGLDHRTIGTQHLLLGLIQEDEGVAAMAFRALDIAHEAVRDCVTEQNVAHGSPEGHIPFTRRAKKVLELSLREALQLGHNYVGTGHVVLGIIREGEGLGAAALIELDQSLVDVRNRILTVLREQPIDERNGMASDRRHSDGPPRPLQDEPAPKTRTIVETVRLRMVEATEMSEEQRAALVRSSETVQHLVQIHLAEGSWSPESGFDLGVEEDVRADADFLAREFRRLSDTPPNLTLVAQLEARLNNALLMLIPDGEVNPVRLAEFKLGAIDKISAIDGVEDLDAAIAAVDHLAFAARFEADRDNLDSEAAWLEFADGTNDPYEIFGRAMGWIASTEVTPERAARATTMIASSIASAIAIGVAASTGVTVTAALAVAGGSVAILTGVVSSIVWYLRARLQPKLMDGD